MFCINIFVFSLFFFYTLIDRIFYDYNAFACVPLCVVFLLVYHKLKYTYLFVYSCFKLTKERKKSLNRWISVFHFLYTTTKKNRERETLLQCWWLHLYLLRLVMISTICLWFYLIDPFFSCYNAHFGMLRSCVTMYFTCSTFSLFIFSYLLCFTNILSS